MGTTSLSAAGLLDLVRSPYADDELASGLTAVVVAMDDDDALRAVPDMGSLPFVAIGIGTEADVARHLVDPVGLLDVVVVEGDPLLDALLAGIERCPVAATAFAVLLRASAMLPVEHGLSAESAAYSVLQSGSEFATWRQQSRHRPASASATPAVAIDRDDTTLRITLDRPARHNAFSREMRDGLSEALAIALVDDSIERVELRGNGPSFCSGGDLGEFGSFADPADAHRTRLSRSPARLLARLAARPSTRVEVSLHGACMGAGIELPAFADHVVADPASTIALPEIALGLIPGAGGTVSVTRRIGRHRCALLGLSGAPISASTALEWGLVDAVSPTTGAASRP